jgi:hypothetical protein
LSKWATGDFLRTQLHGVSWCVYGCSFRDYVASNVEIFATFRQNFHLLSSEWIWRRVYTLALGIMSEVMPNASYMSHQTNPKHINSEDGNWKVCGNVGKPSTFDVPWSRNPNPHINECLRSVSIYKQTALTFPPGLHISILLSRCCGTCGRASGLGATFLVVVRRH